MARARLALASLLVPAVCLAQVPAGPEFRVNAYTSGAQGAAAVATTADGSFVVTWETWDGSVYGVRAQRFSSAGTRLGDELAVNGVTDHSGSFRLSVTSSAQGAFVVVWERHNPDTPGWEVVGRRFAASGTPLGGEFEVNTFTTGDQRIPAVASDPTGNFVVVWDGPGEGDDWGVFARRYDQTGTPVGAEFRVNTYTTWPQIGASVAADPLGGFVVCWTSDDRYGGSSGIFAQRFAASGLPAGGEFRLNAFTTGARVWPRIAVAADRRFVVTWESHFVVGPGTVNARMFDAAGVPVGPELTVATGLAFDPAVAIDEAGNFVVVWNQMYLDGDVMGVFARRYDRSSQTRGATFQVNSYTTGYQQRADAASDRAGNLVVAWSSAQEESGDVFAQRFGGLLPDGMRVDTAGNGVLEPGEAADVRPSWRNVNGTAQSFSGTAAGLTGPLPAIYYIADGSADYVTVANGAVAECSDCYGVAVLPVVGRPVLHWDAVLDEKILPDVLGQDKLWRLHLGGSFADVAASSTSYRHVEALLHHGATSGCSATDYCPAVVTPRGAMAAFVLVGKEGAGYRPAACTTPVFADVPASSPLCPFVEELARRGVVGGCGGGNYCPDAPVTREQMPVFVLRTLDPGLDPPACTTPMFADVPASSPFCRWIEELARRGVVAGCGGGSYCPLDPVTREQMAVFVTVTFGLSLYGP